MCAATRTSEDSTTALTGLKLRPSDHWDNRVPVGTLSLSGAIILRASGVLKSKPPCSTQRMFARWIGLSLRIEIPL